MLKVAWPYCDRHRDSLLQCRVLRLQPRPWIRSRLMRLHNPHCYLRRGQFFFRLCTEWVYSVLGKPVSGLAFGRPSARRAVFTLELSVGGFVDAAAWANCDKLDRAILREAINNPELSDPEAAQTSKLFFERLATSWSLHNGLQSGTHLFLDRRVEAPNELSHFIGYSQLLSRRTLAHLSVVEELVQGVERHLSFLERLEP